MFGCYTRLFNYLTRCLLDASSQITSPMVRATQPGPTMPCCKLYILLLIHNTKGWDGKVLCLWAQYQSSSGHYTGKSSFLDPSSQIMEPTASMVTKSTPSMIMIGFTCSYVSIVLWHIGYDASIFHQRQTWSHHRWPSV